MKHYFYLLLMCWTHIFYTIPSEYYRSFVPRALLEELAKKTDWPEIEIEHEYEFIRHMSISIDNKYIVLSDGNKTDHIKIKRILNPIENETYTRALLSYLKSWFSYEPTQVATQPENQDPRNEYIRKCFLSYRQKELIERIICTLDGNYFLTKEKTEHLEKPCIKLIDIRDFARFAQEMVLDQRYKGLLITIEEYYQKNELWYIENDPNSYAIFEEFPILVKELLRNVLLPK